MSIIIKAANNAALTVRNSNATFNQVLSDPQVLSFFGKEDAADLISSFDRYTDDENGETNVCEFNANVVAAIMNSVVEDGTVIYIDLNGRTGSPAPSAQAVPTAAAATGTIIPVVGTVLLQWNGGMNQARVTGIQLGTTTVGAVLQNGYVANKFGTTLAALSACDITVQNGDNMTRVSQQAAQTRPVQDGDVIWLQARAADDKGC